MNRDLEIKTLTFTYPESSLGVIRYRTIYMTEKDVIDVKFKRNSDTVTRRTRGEIIKIGIDEDTNRYYFVVIAYDYTEDNVFKIHIDEIKSIVNINHSVDPYSFNTVYSPDESVIMVKAVEGQLMFSHDGETWVPVAGSASTSDGRVYKTTGTITDETDADTIPTSGVVLETIRSMISDIEIPEPEYIYDKCVENGLTLTKNQFAKALVDLVSNMDRIFTAYYSAEDVENNAED